MHLKAFASTTSKLQRQNCLQISKTKLLNDGSTQVGTLVTLESHRWVQVQLLVQQHRAYIKCEKVPTTL